MNYPKNIFELYNGDDLEILFKGGFINFGYWDEELLAKNILENNDLIKANNNLAKKIFKQLDLKETNNIIEIGCGFGSVCISLRQFKKVKSLIGIDLFEKHIEEAKKNCNFANIDNINFIQGCAENIPFGDKSFNKLYSLEAFQHFNVKKSISEFARVLKKNSILVISTLFVKDRAYFQDVLKLLPRTAIIGDKNDYHNAALPEVLQILKSENFNIVSLETIGNNVWEGYDRWVKEKKINIWDVNWLIVYEKNFIDYFIIKAIHL